MVRATSCVLAVIVLFSMCGAAQATFIVDSNTNGVVFNDNFEGQSLGTLGSRSAPTGSWWSYANGASAVNVVNTASGGFAANEGSKYLQISRPDSGGQSVAAYADGLESASKDFDTIVAKFAFRLNAGGYLLVSPTYPALSTELANLYLTPDGKVQVLAGDENAWTILTQTQNVGAWNTVTISRTNGDFTAYSAYGSDYSVSINGQTPETMPQLYTTPNNRLFPFAGLEFNGQGGTVSVDAIAVPEPSAVVLLASGAIGLLAYAWRKRK